MLFNEAEAPGGGAAAVRCPRRGRGTLACTGPVADTVAAASELRPGAG